MLDFASMSHSRRSRASSHSAQYTPLLENGYEISAEGKKHQLELA